jgi:hypothetical protein
MATAEGCCGESTKQIVAVREGTTGEVMPIVCSIVAYSLQSVSIFLGITVMLYRWLEY